MITIILWILIIIIIIIIIIVVVNKLRAPVRNNLRNSLKIGSLI
jgi:hypothetical protein